MPSPYLQYVSWANKLVYCVLHNRPQSTSAAASGPLNANLSVSTLPRKWRYLKLNRSVASSSHSREVDARKGCSEMDWKRVFSVVRKNGQSSASWSNYQQTALDLIAKLSTKSSHFRRRKTVHRQSCGGHSPPLEFPTSSPRSIISLISAPKVASYR